MLSSHRGASFISEKGDRTPQIKGPVPFLRTTAKEGAVSMNRSTTILAVRRNGKVAIGGDGQVTLGNAVMKSDAHKLRRLLRGRVIVGVAGPSADALAPRAR